MPIATVVRHSTLPAETRRILVIKLRAVGDVLLSTIVLQNIRKAFPAAVLDVLTETPSADIVRSHPAVSEVLVYDRHAMSGLELIRMVRRRRYDVVFDLFGTLVPSYSVREHDRVIEQMGATLGVPSQAIWRWLL